LQGGVPFHVFFAHTPEDLMREGGLYNTVAVPLYSSAEHRVVSLRLLRKALGGRGVRRRAAVSRTNLRALFSRGSYRVRQSMNLSISRVTEDALAERTRVRSRAAAARSSDERPSSRFSWLSLPSFTPRSQGGGYRV